MARIQKKKLIIKRKTKEDENPVTQISSKQPERVDEKFSEGDTSFEISDGEKEKKKKQPPATIQTVNTEQSAVLKLIDKYFGSWIQFFREVRVELGKVTWPSRKQTLGSTAVVIVFVFIIALFLGAVDLGLTNIIRLIL